MTTLLIVGGCGVLFVAKALYDAWSGIRLRRVGVRTSGVVVGHDRTDVDSGVRYTAVVGFADSSGVSREFRAHGSHPTPHPQEGAVVPVFFLPEDSRPPQIALPLYNLYDVLALLWVGVLLIAGAIFFAIVGAEPFDPA